MSKAALTKPAAYTPDNVKTNYDANIDASNANFTELYAVLGGASSANAAPTTGAHQVREIVWNSEPAAGEYIGWVCTVAGTPGTWLGFGAIEEP